MSKYIGVQFFSDYSKTYTYISNRTNNPLKENDFVVVPTPTGNTVAKVVKVDLPTPSYQCKEIIKKVRL